MIVEMIPSKFKLPVVIGVSMISFIMIGANSNSGGGKTLMVQAIGLDRKNSDQNYPVFYKSAETFTQLCKEQGVRIPEDCKSFVDLGIAPSKKPGLEAESTKRRINPNEVQSKPFGR